MKGRLVDESVKVYAETGDQSLSVATLYKGDLFELGKVSRKNKQVWVEVTLESGQKGFISGETKIFSIKKVQTITKTTDLYREAGNETDVIKTYPKNSVFTTVSVEEIDGKPWVKVMDADGLEGYINGNSRIKLFQEVTKDSAKKLMINGGIFIALAGVFYYISATQYQSGNSLQLIVLVVIAFGLFQFIQGAWQFYTLRKNSEK